MPEPAKRVKIRRKDLRGPDEFETLTGETLVWAREHQTVLVAAAFGLLVLAVIGLLLIQGRAARNQDASARFQQAQQQLEAGNAAAAAMQFAGIEANASSTPYGRLAGLFEGHARLAEGDAAAAATAYSEFLSSASAPEYIRQQALLGLARAKEAAGDTAGALDSYTQAEKLDGPLRADAAFGAARMHEAQGQADRAREIYARLLKDAPDGWMRPLVAAKVPDAPAEEAALAPGTGNVR